MSGVIRTKANPAQPAATDGNASGRGGLPSDAVQIVAYDPSGVVSPADHERAWGIRNLRDYVGFEVIRFDFSWDTPGILEGVVFARPAAGDVVYFAVAITTSFDASFAVTTFVQGETLPHNNDLTEFAPHVGSAVPVGGGVSGGTAIGHSAFGNNSGFVSNGTPLMVLVDDGSGADAGDTRGEGFVITYINRA